MPLMHKAKNILLASHGTPGAQAAEHVALDICTNNAQVTHLYVVPEFWQHILGDDWLNNNSTRKQFSDYLEAQLEKEMEQHIKSVHTQLEKQGIPNTHMIILGDPQKCLINICNESRFDLVILGSPRPKGICGLHSRMLGKQVVHQLKTKILQIPHPNA